MAVYSNRISLNFASDSHCQIRHQARHFPIKCCRESEACSAHAWEVTDSLWGYKYICIYIYENWIDLWVGYLFKSSLGMYPYFFFENWIDLGLGMYPSIYGIHHGKSPSFYKLGKITEIPSMDYILLNELSFRKLLKCSTGG